jgi:glutaredoxin-like protein
VALISEQDRATIAQMFEGNLLDPVRLVLFTIPPSLLYVPGQEQCATCKDVQQLAEELVTISDKLSLDVHNLQREPEEARRYGVTRVPTLLLEGPEDGRVRFYGAPAGYEFSTLLNDIQLISKGETELAAETREALQAIEEPIHIQVFVTPT